MYYKQTTKPRKFSVQCAFYRFFCHEFLLSSPFQFAPSDFLFTRFIRRRTKKRGSFFTVRLSISLSHLAAIKLLPFYLIRESTTDSFFCDCRRSFRESEDRLIRKHKSPVRFSVIYRRPLERSLSLYGISQDFSPPLTLFFRPLSRWTLLLGPFKGLIGDRPCPTGDPLVPLQN